MSRHRISGLTIGFYLFLALLSCFTISSILINQYASQYEERSSDIAIILGAGTSNGKLSPVFRERIAHGQYLLEKGMVDHILLTGGFGKGQQHSDAQIAKTYLIEQGVPEDRILIEEQSRYTHENLIEAQKLMDALNLTTA
ncbi:MAG: YdcF family protein, partial [Bacteroidota bacterium]